ncbi:Hypothetical protein POVN_LOCUS357 [uncultured virus]|nr:Hypothetical protein POVN_LOCUS357 [uncultured virus]
MVDQTLDTLIELTDRLAALRDDPRPSEAQALIGWISSNGLSTLAPGLTAFLEQVGETATVFRRPKGYTSPSLSPLARQAAAVPLPSSPRWTPRVEQKYTVAVHCYCVQLGPVMAAAGYRTDGPGTVLFDVDASTQVADVVQKIADVLDVRFEQVSLLRSALSLEKLRSDAPIYEIAKEQKIPLFLRLDREAKNKLESMNVALVRESKTPFIFNIRADSNEKELSYELINKSGKTYTVDNKTTLGELKAAISERLQPHHPIPAANIWVGNPSHSDSETVFNTWLSHRSDWDLGEQQLTVGTKPSPASKPARAFAPITFTSTNHDLIKVLTDAGFDTDLKANTFTLSPDKATATVEETMKMITDVLGVEPRTIQLKKASGGYLFENEMIHVQAAKEGVQPIIVHPLFAATQAITQKMRARAKQPGVVTTVKIVGNTIFDKPFSALIEQKDPNYSVEYNTTIGDLRQRIATRLGLSKEEIDMSPGFGSTPDDTNVIDEWYRRSENPFLVTRKKLPKPIPEGKKKLLPVSQLVRRFQDLQKQVEAAQVVAAAQNTLAEQVAKAEAIKPLLTELYELTDMIKYYQYMEEAREVNRKQVELQQRINKATFAEKEQMLPEMQAILEQAKAFVPGGSKYAIVNKFVD